MQCTSLHVPAFLSVMAVFYIIDDTHSNWDEMELLRSFNWHFPVWSLKSHLSVLMMFPNKQLKW